MYNNRNIFTFIGISMPIILIAILQIFPTFDDWTTLSCPNRDSHFIQYFLPYGMTWRPGDALIGYINGIHPKLFPSLNHILILFTHLGSTILLYFIAKKLEIQQFAINIATLFFYISPCVLGNILSCDATNQSFAHFFGLLSVYCYLKKDNYLVWMLCVYLSAAFKDNGIAWAVIPPIISYAFGKIEKEKAIKDLAFGFVIAIIYGIIRIVIPHHIFVNASYSDDIVSINSHLNGIGKWIGYTWICMDYISLFHQPSRNLLLVGITFVLSIPFMAYLWFHKKTYRQRTFWLLLVAFITVVSPNLLINMTIMNAYGSLGIAAIIVAYLVQQRTFARRRISILFSLYLISAFIVALHHWYKAWQTSLPEKYISQEIIRKTNKPVNKAYCILIKDDYPKYSSFCVPKDETIGWGKSIWHETGYKWPEHINDTTIERNENSLVTAKEIAQKALKAGYDAAWIVDKEKVEVLSKYKKQ